MKTTMTICEAILDAFADDAESIEQVQSYLDYLEIRISRDLLRRLLIEMLRLGLLQVVFPYNEGVVGYEAARDEDLGEWFLRHTELGYEKWKAIDA